MPFAVGAYIVAAILFTSSTAFANPAATVARSLTDTFAGIAPRSVPMFVIAEFAGAALGPRRSADVVPMHREPRASRLRRRRDQRDRRYCFAAGVVSRCGISSVSSRSGIAKSGSVWVRCSSACSRL